MEQLQESNLIVRLAQAISHAEGYGVNNAIPTRAHNPGDLCLGDRFKLGTLGHGITVFPKADPNCEIDDPNDGWASLYREVRSILQGKSYVYDADWTIQQIADKWTANDSEPWAKIVASRFDVPVSTPLNILT